MPELTALVLNCSLKPSPLPSSTDSLAGLLLQALSDHGVTGSTVRVVDHDVHPGVETDMGPGDAWPAIREQILAADIVVLATPTWLGQHTSVAQRVFERLDAELAETDDDGRPLTYGKVALAVVVGNEDGAHHICAATFQCLDDVGFTVPANGCTYWNGAAMSGTDFRDLDETPEAVASATAAAARTAVHLARLLAEHPYPAA